MFVTLVLVSWFFFLRANIVCSLGSFPSCFCCSRSCRKFVLVLFEIFQTFLSGCWSFGLGLFVNFFYCLTERILDADVKTTNISSNGSNCSPPLGLRTSFLRTTTESPKIVPKGSCTYSSLSAQIAASVVSLSQKFLTH